MIPYPKSSESDVFWNLEFLKVSGYIKYCVLSPAESCAEPHNQTTDTFQSKMYGY